MKSTMAVAHAYGLRSGDDKDSEPRLETNTAHSEASFAEKTWHNFLITQTHSLMTVPLCS